MDPEQPKTHLPHHRKVDDDVDTATNIAAKGVVQILEEMRVGPATGPTRRKKVTVAPRCSIAVEDLVGEGTYSRILFIFRDIFVMYLFTKTGYFYPPDNNATNLGDDVSDTAYVHDPSAMNTNDVDDTNDVNTNAPATKTAHKTRTPKWFQCCRSADDHARILSLQARGWNP